MHKFNTKPDTSCLFERLFWIFSCIPVCLFFADRMILFSNYTFQGFSVLFGVAGFAIGLVLIAFFIWKRPLTSFFPPKIIPYLAAILFISGIVLGLLFCDHIIFYGQTTASPQNFYIWMVLAGCGLAAVLCIALVIYALIHLILSVRKSASRIDKLQSTPKIPAKHTNLILICMAVLFGCALCWANSRVFYYWDYVIYHELSRDLATIGWQTPGTFIASVYDSIQSWDYNLAGAVLPALLMRVFGTSRGAFLTLTTMIYLIPSIVVFYLITSHWQTDLVQKDQKGPLFPCIILWFPYLLFVTYQGSIDVGGVVLMLGCIFFYFSEDKPSAYRFSLCGFFLAMLVIYRRWFMFWCVSFALCSVVHQLIIVLTKKASWTIKLKEYIFNIALLLGFFGGFLFLFFQPMLVEKFILNDVSSAYQAYAGSLSKNFTIMRNYFGILLLVLVAAAAIYCLCSKKTAKLTSFLCIQTGLCFFFFTRVQVHDTHHLMLYVPFMLCILTLALAQVQRRIGLKKCRIAYGVLIAASVLNLINTFSANYKVPLLAEFNMQLSGDPNTGEFLSLLYALDSEVGETDKKVLILSASDDLNTEKLIYAESSFNLSDKKRDYFLSYAIVDTRDGFQESLFDADLIVVPTPIQAYMGESKMRVISVPTQYFYQDKGFAKAYKAGEQYRINPNTTVTLYHKTREVTPQEKEELKEELASYYPDLPELFPAK